MDFRNGHRKTAYKVACSLPVDTFDQYRMLMMRQAVSMKRKKLPYDKLTITHIVHKNRVALNTRSDSVFMHLSETTINHCYQIQIQLKHQQYPHFTHITDIHRGYMRDRLKKNM